jgi:hypothetical protein
MADATLVTGEGRAGLVSWWLGLCDGALVLLQPDQEHLGQHLVHQVLQQGWDPAQQFGCFVCCYSTVVWLHLHLYGLKSKGYLVNFLIGKLIKIFWSLDDLHDLIYLPSPPHPPVVKVQGDHRQARGEGHQGDGHPIVQTWNKLFGIKEIMKIVSTWPMSGSFSEVGGMLSPITMRKTVMERSVVMPRVTWPANIICVGKIGLENGYIMIGL